MPNPHRHSELALIVAFLAIIGAVPVSQCCLELVRHQRVQAMDVFRYPPTAGNLREFEHTLEEKSWVRQQLRPEVQRLLFTSLRDPGAKAVLGRDQWLFYRPDLRYVVEPDRPEADAGDGKWIQATRGSRRESVEREILRFHDQLKQRGVALVVMPVPAKPSVYPEQATRRAAGLGRAFHSPTQELLDSLERQGVATVDLYAVFREARAREAGSGAGSALYLARDTHWTPWGAQLAAQAVAAQLGKMQLAPAATKAFRTQRVPVTRWGDVLEMMQIPGLRSRFKAETVECQQVLDPVFGPMVPRASDRPGTYCYPGQQATVLVLGDSFSRIYQYPEPASLGETPGTKVAGAEPGAATRRLLPGSAGFVSQLALALQSPVDAIVSDGGAATDVRRKLSINPEILEGKRIVVWEFVERDIALGSQGWEDVALPTKLE